MLVLKRDYLHFGSQAGERGNEELLVPVYLVFRQFPAIFAYLMLAPGSVLGGLDVVSLRRAWSSTLGKKTLEKDKEVAVRFNGLSIGKSRRLQERRAFS